MPQERVFLGWDRPALPSVADWLLEHFAGRLDAPIVVLPTGRAVRRLTELLVEKSGGALAGMPTIETAGGVPELLYQPTSPIADEWSVALARLHVLRQADEDRLAVLVTKLPVHDDLPAWWALADRLSTVAKDLAGAGMRIADVIRAIEQMKLDATALPRLRELDRLEQAYRETLASQGVIDQQAARLHAIQNAQCQTDRPVVVACMADISYQLVRMVGQLDSFVTALIQAPSQHAEGFGPIGEFLPNYWVAYEPPIDDGQLHFVDRPMDQARQVIVDLADAKPAIDSVTVGLGDEAMAVTVKRALESAGTAARYAGGRPVARSRPVMLLRAIAKFSSTHRFDDFAALLRHPDLAGKLDDPQATEDWLSLLDRYASDHLQGDLFGTWLGDEDRAARLKDLWQRVTALLPDTDHARPLPQWANAIVELLTAIYGDAPLSRHASQDHSLFVTLQTIGKALRGLAAIDEDSPTTPQTGFAHAVGFVIQSISQQAIPEPGGGAAIELMGFLDLPLDDAPHLILTGLNEGNIPAAHTSDPWLPDSMRAALGLPDNQRRLARDLYLLSSILYSRPHVALIAGRRSTQGDPLAPSRLLLRTEANLAQRVRTFYEADEGDAPPPMLLEPGKRDRFLIPKPALDAPRLSELRVTAFRDYLACPYRFYLRHVLRLQTVADGAAEMDALAFGNLAHHVLESFAKSDCKDAQDAGVICEFLDQKLDSLARWWFGSEPRMAIRLQIEQLRSRLHSFAPHQAQWRSEGWEIVDREKLQAEQSLRANVTVDGQAITLTGRVDRIDHHPQFGYRILDYKTSDTAKAPDATHRRGSKHEKQWVDLQLPLYHTLCAPLGVVGDVALGYINLPKKLEDTGLQRAMWDEDELADAMAVRDEVIRNVLAGVYWPPSEPPAFGDDYAAICGDLVFDRDALIRASEEAQP